MHKYYKTPRTSETGCKFQVVFDKIAECRQAQIAMADKYGFSEWRGAYWAVRGGFSSVIFVDKPDVKLWKCKDGEYTPRCSNTAGKAIETEFNNMPCVLRGELNECIGWDEQFSVIGVQYTDPNFFGFLINADKVKSVPEDCIEITGTEYETLEDTSI